MERDVEPARARGDTAVVDRGPVMKIERVDVYGYDLTYVYGRYVMSGGRVIETLPSTVVRVTTASGVEGFGEVCPLGPAYLPSHGAGARAALGELAPAVIGLEAGNLGAVQTAMDRALMGHGYAKSAIDTACWDALGRSVGLPVCDLLGGRLSDGFPLYFAVPLGSAEDMTAYVQARRAEGIHRFQLKIGADPYEDAARTRSVVEATGPEDIVVADANGGWLVQDAVVAARAIEGLERVFFEQPCPTLEECLIVRQRTTLPMVLDECIRDVHSLLRAYEARAMEAFNLKISKVGGLTRAKLMRDLAVALGLRLTIEDSWGGDIVTAAVAHLAASTPPETLFTVSFMNDWTNEHVAGHEPRSQDGFGSAPDRPGLGIDVDLEALGAPLFSAGR
jgi:L-alanine-DL-glutamate epimerase-like enolase superfamily enzyme